MFSPETDVSQAVCLSVCLYRQFFGIDVSLNMILSPGMAMK